MQPDLKQGLLELFQIHYFIRCFYNFQKKIIHSRNAKSSLIVNPPTGNRFFLFISLYRISNEFGQHLPIIFPILREEKILF